MQSINLDLRISVLSIIEVHQFDTYRKVIYILSSKMILTDASVPGTVESADVLHDGTIFSDRKMRAHLAGDPLKGLSCLFESRDYGGMDNDGVDN